MLGLKMIFFRRFSSTHDWSGIVKYVAFVVTKRHWMTRSPTIPGWDRNDPNLIQISLRQYWFVISFNQNRYYRTSKFLSITEVRQDHQRCIKKQKILTPKLSLSDLQARSRKWTTTRLPVLYQNRMQMSLKATSLLPDLHVLFKPAEQQIRRAICFGTQMYFTSASSWPDRQVLIENCGKKNSPNSYKIPLIRSWMKVINLWWLRLCQE